MPFYNIAHTFHENKYLFLIIDVLVVKVGRDRAVRPTGVLLIYGINDEGIREQLGLLVANSGSEGRWSKIFKRLKAAHLKRS